MDLLGRILGVIIVAAIVIAIALGIHRAWTGDWYWEDGSGGGGGRSACPIVTDEGGTGTYASTQMTDAKGRFCKIGQLDHAIKFVTPPNTWTDLWDGSRAHMHVPSGTSVIGNEFSFWPDP